MITDLTEEQKAKLPEYRDKWIEIGKNCDPINKERAVAAIDKMYQCGNVKPPTYHLFFQSPIDVLYAAQVCDKYSELKKENINQEWFDKIVSFIRKSAESKAIDETVLNSLDVDKESKFFKNLLNNIESEKKSLQEYTQYFTYGNHEAVWLSFYEFFNNETEVDLHEIEGLVEVAKECGWGIFMDEVSLVSEKPEQLHLDSQTRLHNTEGPAFSFRDGFKIYSVNGVVVPEDIIEDRSSLTVDRIDKESNAEIKRIMINLFGQDNYLMAGGAEVIDNDPEFGTLYKKHIEGDPEDLLMVKVVNATPEPEPDENGNPIYKDYFLRVPPTVKTAQEAVEWTFDKGKTVPFYKPQFQS